MNRPLNIAHNTLPQVFARMGLLPHYVRARELKAAGMDWTEVLAAQAENPRARLAAELLASAAYGSTAARVRAFMEQGGGCRATFFNYRRKLNGENGSGNKPGA